MIADHKKDILKWVESLADKYQVAVDLVRDLFEVQYGEAGSIDTRKRCTENFLRSYFEERES